MVEHIEPAASASPQQQSPAHGMGTHPEMTVTAAWLDSVLDIAADAIVVIDDQARILVFNKACQDLFGYTPEEMIGRNVRELMPPAYADAHDGYLRNYLTTGERRIIGIGREVAAMNKLGDVFAVELSVGEAVTTHGRQFIGILRDLRPRKAFEQRLGQLQAQVLHMARLNAVDEMGAVMAHELNQPLTALMLYLQALSRKMSPPDEAIPDLSPGVALTNTILDKALKEAQRAASIIQRMRTMVEKKRVDFEVEDVRRVVADAVEHATFVAQGATVPITKSIPDAPLMVELDAVQIQQILANLLRNAIEVSQQREPRWVHVSVTASITHVQISVEDSGPGVPLEAVDQLFRSFATTKRGGMGLGLAISRQLAQNHGGDLTVDPGGQIAGSDQPRGAIFKLVLPLYDPRRSAAAAEPDHTS